MMRSYFLALSTVVVVSVGCSSYDTCPDDCNGGGPGGSGGYPSVDSNQYHAPPAQHLLRPGPMVDGPGPGVLPMMGGMGMGAGGPFSTQTSQIRFIGPAGMGIGWQINGGFAEEQLTAPGRYNFNQGATYRLKLTNVPDRAGMVLYPTLQVYMSQPTTDAYLSHNPIPIQLTDEDIDQVDANNFVTKVIYLPDAEHQELAIAGVETLVSTRLDPGVDPVREASRRGSIMAVIRIGNMDLEMADGMPVAGANGQVLPASHIRHISGKNDQHAPPMPIGYIGADGVPTAMMMGAPRAMGGVPAYNPVSGVNGTPIWGQPMTSTPIGLPGPPHLPYGGPAGLRSHTVRNLTKTHIPGPTRDLLIDVKHKPGINMPDPVNYVEYEERHYGAKPIEHLKQHRASQIELRTILDGNQLQNCPPGAQQ